MHTCITCAYTWWQRRRLPPCPPRNIPPRRPCDLSLPASRHPPPATRFPPPATRQPPRAPHLSCFALASPSPKAKSPPPHSTPISRNQVDRIAYDDGGQLGGGGGISSLEAEVQPTPLQPQPQPAPVPAPVLPRSCPSPSPSPSPPVLVAGALTAARAMPRQDRASRAHGRECRAGACYEAAEQAACGPIADAAALSTLSYELALGAMRPFCFSGRGLCSIRSSARAVHVNACDIHQGQFDYGFKLRKRAMLCTYLVRLCVSTTLYKRVRKCIGDVRGGAPHTRVLARRPRLGPGGSP